MKKISIVSRESFRRFLILHLVIVLLVGQAFSQRSKFYWDEENCSCRGMFDPTKYSRTEILNTLKYLMNVELVHTRETAFRIEDLKKLNTQELDSEYTKRKSELNTSGFIKTNYWDSLRLIRLRELEDQYELKRISILAHDNPALLKNAMRAVGLCDQYIEPLIAGGQRLLAAWRELIDLQMSRNGDPQRVFREYTEARNSPDSLTYARMQIMTFGWWNCANQTIRYVENEHLLFIEFRKLFKRIKCKCIDY